MRIADCGLRRARQDEVRNLQSIDQSLGRVIRGSWFKPAKSRLSCFGGAPETTN